MLSIVAGRHDFSVLEKKDGEWSMVGGWVEDECNRVCDDLTELLELPEQSEFAGRQAGGVDPFPPEFREQYQYGQGVEKQEGTDG